MYWWAEGYAPKRGAEVLAVRPRKQRGRPARQGSARGAARWWCSNSSAPAEPCSSASTRPWRWRFREDELHFNQFWIQTVRYLARSRLGRVELRLDKQTPYRRGEPIKVTVRFPDDAPPPGPETEVKVRGGAPGGPGSGAGDAEMQTLPLAKLEGSRADLRGRPDADAGGRVSLLAERRRP